MLIYRVLSAIVGIPLAIAIIWYGDIFLFAALVLLVGLGLKEFFNITSNMGLPAEKSFSYFSSLLLLITFYFAPSHIMFTITLIFLGVLTLMVLNYPQLSFKAVGSALVGVFYIAFLFGFMLLIRQLPSGEILLIFLFLLNWSSDTFAYFVGRALGRKKLAPKVSPNKTVEGSLGGILGTIVVALLIGNWLLDISNVDLIAIGTLVSIFGQLGDLTESALKRMGKVKDSGKLIPGHGGVLDRFDSILFTAPLLYFYFIYVLRI